MIRPLLTDADDRVRFHAARSRVRELGSADCLPVFVALLNADTTFSEWDTFIRTSSVHALRTITGQYIGYQTGLDEADQRKMIRKWHAWVSDHAAAAELTFECVPFLDLVPRNLEGEKLIPVLAASGGVVYRQPPRISFSEEGFLVASPGGEGEKPSLLDNPNPIKLSYDLEEMPESRTGAGRS
ncbi:MAG: HEAT repeat domain-containing protein [Verrucomicrobiales bacterium]